MSPKAPELISPPKLHAILDGSSPDELLILDLRATGQFAKSRIHGALNLCVPSTLIKRPAYGLKKLGDSLANGEADRAKFDSWKNVDRIIVYDAASWNMTQAASCVQVINKFLKEDFPGATYVLQGGINAFIGDYPNSVDERPLHEILSGASGNLSINPSASNSVVGGCELPTENAVKPFFNNIRQNMDLIGGVGQFPLRRPPALTTNQIQRMPAWLRDATASPDKGKAVADRFLRIEKAEQQRMQQALSVESWQSRGPATPNAPKIAGLEKGTKNRYKDILPFESTRVRLGERSHEGDDYVNASHIKPRSTNMHYIACQAPVPSTFQDFWRVIWEQEASVIVMLTAETEEGNLKAHPYWKSGMFGNFKVNLVQEHTEDMHYQGDFKLRRSSQSLAAPSPHKAQQPPLSRRHTSAPSTSAIELSTSAKTHDLSPHHSDVPQVTIRRLEIFNTSTPSQPPRTISQVQLASWPDTGSTARPKDVLALVDLCDSLDPNNEIPWSSPEQRKRRPLIVHCSAGCGRTGTFCTVANVKHMLLRQLAHRHPQSSSNDAMDVDGEEWLTDETTDLVALTVAEFRLSRMSMVQTLRQFVLCYEAIMELFVHDDWYVGGLEEVRREEIREGKLAASKRPVLGKRAATAGSVMSTK